MKHSLLKSLGSLLLVVVLCFGTCCSAFATEIGSNIAFNADNSTISDVETKITRNGGYATGTIPANGKLTLHPELNNYVGLSMTLFVDTSSIYSDNNPSGTIRVWVYKPVNSNGERILLKFIETSANNFVSYKFTLPPAGEYTVDIESDVKERVYISVGWTNKL